MATTLRLSDDENRVVDALQADLHASSRAEVFRQAIFALAKQRGLLVERRFAQVLPPRMAARQGVPR
jgi:predicted transcriptional regulator